MLLVALPLIAQIHSKPFVLLHGGREQATMFSPYWAGYAVTGRDFTSAKGSWIVPPVDCSASTTDEHSSFWVGIDGYYSNTIEQAGTVSNCIEGAAVYYAWYEFYPDISYRVMTVNPGDRIKAGVEYSGTGEFTVTIADITTGEHYTTRATVEGAQRTSAEWIVEAPSWGMSPLTNFGTAQMGIAYTQVAETNTARGHIDDTVKVVMESSTAKAQPSALLDGKSSFTVRWLQ